jgi:chaperonin GroEL
MSSILKDAYVLLVEEKINNVNDLLPVLEFVSNQNKSLLIVAKDYSQEVLSTLIVNKMKGIIKVAAINSPGFGDRKLEILEDIATVTGGEVLSETKGMSFEEFNYEWLGKADKITITKNETTIIDGKGDEEKIENRIEDLKSQIDNSKSMYEKEQLQERLSKLIGGISVIYVGAQTETEMLEKKDRIDDALHASKAALQEGILPGGGTSLLRVRKILDEKILGEEILKRALIKPFYTILKNAGYDDVDIFNHINKIDEEEDKWVGFDLFNKSYINFKKQGIIDPFKVVKIILQNSVSTAGTVLITEGIIYDINEEKNEELDPMMGMM